MLSTTNVSLLDALQAPGVQPAWRRFYERYVPLLTRLARRLEPREADAADAVADTLMAAFEALQAGGYDRSRGPLRSWLCGILRHKLITIQRARRARDDSGNATNESADSDDANPLQAAIEREWSLDLLSRGVDVLRRELAPSAYQAFDLFAVRGWSAQETADFLDMTCTNVYTTKSRALARLREILARLRAEEVE